MLGQAAHIAKRHPEFASTYQNIAARRGKKIATVAVARKLFTRAYHLLADAEADTTADTASSETTENGTCVARTSRARPQTGRVTKPRVPLRHEPATGRARASD